MNTIKSKLVSSALTITLAVLTIFWVVNSVSAAPTIETDWPSYVPGEIVTINGNGFHVSETVTVTIQWPLERIDTVYAIINSDSNFTCTYQLPINAQHGTYTVTATDQSGTSASTMFSGTEDFYGYNLETGNWTKGNLGSAYIEGDFVSYELYLDTASKAWGNNFTICFDFHQDNTNAIYVDGFDTSVATGFQYTGTSSLLPDGTDIPPPGWGIHIPTPEAGESASPGNPQITAFMDPCDPTFVEPTNPTPTQVSDQRDFNVTNLPWNTFTNGYVILFFRAHLALDIIWSHGLESALPVQLDGNEFQDWTNTFHGSSFATGSSRHFILEFPGIGSKEIPIPIAVYPATFINGYKYVDNVLFNGWNITLTGNLTLGSGLPPIPYNPPTVQTGMGTFINGSAWPTGYFEFTGLVTGDYNVTEENRAGYLHVNIVTSGSGTNVQTNIAQGWATFSLLGGGNETIRFYNTFAVPAVNLTKTASTPKVENGTTVTYTYNATNTGNVPLTANLTDNQFGTIFNNQPMNPNQSIVTDITRVLTSTTTNIANLTAFYPPTSAYVNTTATATVTVIHPAINLTKTASAPKVENGTTVTYTYVVSNVGDTQLTGVNVTDNKLGAIAGPLTLASGSNQTFTKTATLTTTTTNTATAAGIDQLGTNVTATASATVTVIHPTINLTKTVSAPKIENATSVTYTFVVSNIGDTQLNGVNVTDDVLGSVVGPLTLAAGANQTITRTTTLTATTANTAQAAGVDQLGTNVTASAQATVTVIHPSISLSKTVSAPKVLNTTTVTYTYNVTNIGDTPLSGINVTDSVLGFIAGPLNLAPAASQSFIRTTTLNATTTNTASTAGVDQLGIIVTASAQASVTVIHPALNLAKTPSAPKIEGDSVVTYTFVVSNIGDTQLTGVNITDNLLGAIAGPLSLAAGASQTFTRTTTLNATTANTASVAGVDQLGTNVTAAASATVTVIHPAISLTKVASASKIEIGGTVTYTYNVTNTGDTQLTGVNITDNQFGSIAGPLSLAAGAFQTFTKTVALNVTITNTAQAAGVDQLGTNVTASAQATVTVISPSISLSKTVSAPKVLNTTAITYTYNVTNTGDTQLTGVNITDSLLGSIAGPLSLAAGASQTFTRTTMLNATTTNIASAAGVDQLGTNVTTTAQATVTVIHPAISVNKTCEPDNQFAPANITWTVVVKNIGDVTLYNVTVIESREGFSNFTFAQLAPNQTLTIIFDEFNLPPGTYNNTATATGAYQLGTVSASDDAKCVVKPVFILKQFTGVTVLPVGVAEGFNATLVNGTNVNVFGLKTGPKVYFNVTYYFENSLNFLGESFDGQAHNFTLWDKWGGNLMALGSPPIAFNQKTNVVTLADNSTFDINPRTGGYRSYIGAGLDISNLASQGQAFITMHLGDQQNTTNPGNGKGTGNDGTSYDTDTVWYIGELGVNQSATLTLFIAPGKNPGGQLEFTNAGCTVINTGPRVRAYGDTYNNDDFLYAVERTNTLTVCVKPI